MATGGDRSDPRCPSCDGKVSATADWCMHCGAEFERPVDRQAPAERDDADRRVSVPWLGRRSGDRTASSTGGGTVQRERIRGRDRERGHDSDRRRPSADREAAAGASRTDRRAADGARTDRSAPPGVQGGWEPSFLPDVRLPARRRASRFLGGLGVAGLVGAVGLGLSLPATGASLAALAWLASVAVMARERTGFDAVRYGSYVLMSGLIFVSFALALAAEGQSIAAFLVTLVPVAVATLFVAGFGDTTGLDQSTPE